MIRASSGEFLFLGEIERRVDAADRLNRRIGTPFRGRACEAEKYQSIFCYLKLLMAVGGRDSEEMPDGGGQSRLSRPFTLSVAPVQRRA